MNQAELEILIGKVKIIARKAGDFARENQTLAKRTVEKGKGDYATDIDLNVETMISNELQELDDSIPLYAEESNIKPDSKLYWVVDPIDGTKNYFQGLPTWSVNIALYSAAEKQILLGVIYFPAWDDLFAAYLGGGAEQNEKTITHSQVVNIEDSILYAELPTTSRSKQQDFDRFQNILKASYRTRGWGLASALCYTANGAFDAHLDFSGTTKPFDIYAPLIIATEAGCEVIGFEDDSQPLLVGNKELIEKLQK